MKFWGGIKLKKVCKFSKVCSSFDKNKRCGRFILNPKCKMFIVSALAIRKAAMPSGRGNNK